MIETAPQPHITNKPQRTDRAGFPGFRQIRESGEQGGSSDYEDLFKQTDWLAVVKNIMDMQYKLGNMKGYMDYKQFWDFLHK